MRINFINPIVTDFQARIGSPIWRSKCYCILLDINIICPALKLYTLCRFSTDRKRREIQMRTQIGQKLEEGGERERLKELLRIRLKECGWRDQLKEHCRGVYGHIILGVQSTKVTKKCTHTHTCRGDWAEGSE